MKPSSLPPLPEPAMADDEDDEQFFESLDRVLSSSCSSDDEADHHRRSPPASAARSHAFWTSEPSSVEERRRGLLQQMGLAADAGLSRAQSAADGPHRAPDRGPAVANLRSRVRGLEIRVEGNWGELGGIGTGRDVPVDGLEASVGRSPIVQELLRRENVDRAESSGEGDVGGFKESGGGLEEEKGKKKGNWLKSIRSIAGLVIPGGGRERRSGDEKDSVSDRGGRRSSSATDDSLDGSSSFQHGPERVRVRQYGKSVKEFSGLYVTQEVQAHSGAVWCMKFSLDGRFLASAGEDCVIHVWEVLEVERKREILADDIVGEDGNCYPFLAGVSVGLPELVGVLGCLEGNQGKRKKKIKGTNSRHSVSSDQFMVPEHIFSISEKPICSFKGHTKDVLDLSWSKSLYLLSSSMDKTVKLWHMSSNCCLKTFSHSDYVTCIQFNPVDDKHFISGSLDEKIRLWRVPDRQIVDWNNVHEMITATCFTPDGQAALVGTHKGNCHLFDTSDNKLHYERQVDLEAKRKKSIDKKITGFQFVQGSSSEVLITCADSRIRVLNSSELVHKFKGFRNTCSQISASLSSNGKFVICASEDSHVYIWRYDAEPQPGETKGVVAVTKSYEYFYSRDVTVAITWPGNNSERSCIDRSHGSNDHDQQTIAGMEKFLGKNGLENSCLPISQCNGGSLINGIVDTKSNNFPKTEDILPKREYSSRSSWEFSNGSLQKQNGLAWGMVIVAAGCGGKILIYQNFGFPSCP